MKWKLGAALMVLVLLVGMIPVVMSADGTGSLTSAFSGDHEIVMQVGDNRALLDGSEVALVDNAGTPTPVKLDAGGSPCIPIGVLSEALDITVEWDESGKVATLSRDLITATLTVDSSAATVIDSTGTRNIALPCAVTTADWTVYVPVSEVASMMGCYVKRYPAAEGDLIVLSTDIEGPSEKALGKLTVQALEICGPTYEMVAENVLLVRKNSAHALVNGEQVELEAAVLASKEVNEQAAAGLWLPVSAAPQLTGESVTYNENKQRLEGAENVDVTVFSVVQDEETGKEVLYCEVAKLAEAAGAYNSLIA
ncbi:MAG: hypothetical protein IKM54_05480, partial [Butyricicoccus sp.]|nr:hypothetical protein [Butyricicoccus sp.]